MTDEGPRDSALIARRAFEMIAYFIIVPAVGYQLVHVFGIPLFLIFVPAFALFTLILCLDSSFRWREIANFRLPKQELMRMLMIFAVCAAALYGYTALWKAEAMFGFVRNQPRIWALVMIFYPLISVPTQEIIFRVFFFHRYAPLFGSRINLMIVVNAFFFSLAHILFQNWLAVILSFPGGLLFATTYARTKSLGAVVLEHGLYGVLIFTLGLGGYFFTGVPNF